MEKEIKKPGNTKRILKKLYRFTITVFKVLFLVVPFLAAVVYTNYTIDPGRLYHIDRADMFEYDVVQFMLDGHNAENLSNYNERLVKRDYINRMPEAVDVIVAGSSRGALITKEMLGIDSMFNISVAGGSLEDVIGYFGILREYDMLPKTLIFVFDPWMLNDNYENDYRYRRAVGDGYCSYLTERMGYTIDDPSLYQIESYYEKGSTESISFSDLANDVKLNLISITYFQAAIQRQFNPNAVVRPDTWPTVSDDYNGTNGLLRADGSYSYPVEYRDHTADEATHFALMSLPGSIIGLEEYQELESFNKQMFIDFLRCATEDGVTIKLLLEPISPVLYEWMTNFPRYDNFFLVEEMVYGIAREAGIKITGSFNPETYNMDMRAYYDGYHVRPEYLEKIIEPLL